MKEELKNKDFVQVYRPTIGAITAVAEKNIKAFKLFMLIMSNMDVYNALVVSNVTLQEMMQCSRCTVIRATKYLKEQGLISTYKSGTTNVYVINPDVVWTSYSTQKAYCRFPANVLLTATENNIYLENPKALNSLKQVDTMYVQKSVRQKRELEKLGEELNANL